MKKKLTIDGNTAAAHVAYAMSEVSAIYPITPSTPMAESCDEWTTQGRKNIFGAVPRISELQSEGGASGALHGSLSAGALTTTFTASQGLLLMIPNMYKIAGELLPCVFHVSARALAYHALNIFGDHSDVMSCRQTGFAMLASNSVQESMDMALVAHLSTLTSKVPFMHFFDGFRTSHEVSKIDMIDYDDMAKLVDYDAVRDFKSRALNPEHPIQKGTAQNPDIYFQNREACNKYYDAVPGIVQGYMDDVAGITGRQYNLVEYHGAPDATKVIVIMCSGAETVHETVDYLTARDEKVGVLKVRLYRPFPTQAFIDAIPKSCRNLSVLDRTKESGSVGEPLYQDVMTTLGEAKIRNINVLGGRYGLGSKEFTPSMIKAIYDNMARGRKNHFTVGINDDVTNTSLTVKTKIDSAPAGSICCKFYGLGADGTVGANKNSIKIIGNYTEKFAQGYFAYDSKKSGGITISHLRFGDTPIRSAYLIDSADFVACHNPSYVTKYDMVSSVRDGGTFLLNCNWTTKQLDKELPREMKRYIAKHNIQLYTIDAVKLASSIGLGGRINTVMQSAFFKLSDVLPYEDASKYMKEYIDKTFGRKGVEIVEKNCKAVDIAVNGLNKIEVPASWAKCQSGATVSSITDDKYFNNIIAPILGQKGDDLKVSDFNADGSVPTNTTKFEKRGIANFIPMWDVESCIQCNQCSLVCPHACIRPVLQTTDMLAGAPESFITKNANGFKDYQYRMQISPLDCTGCGSCINVCPAPKKALIAKTLDSQKVDQGANWDYSQTLEDTSATFNKNSLKGSQFLKPYFEFSGACAGCGETPYIKLVTQLFGDNMIISNATGCSSIYGGSAPTCPYSKDSKGRGPSWANSLFEDNAEHGYGMNVAYMTRRLKMKDNAIALAELGYSNEVLEKWLASYADKKVNRIDSDALSAIIEELAANASDAAIKALLIDMRDNKDCLSKKSVWIIGGDGWAYDIGFGGLDHVIASGEDINILVLDTEVYSNTGGQASKASPTGAIAKFAAGGKLTKKKDLGMMAMSYGYVYTAQISMGSNMNQTVKAISEAEAYDGPSLVIAYSPCISHGINMSNTQLEMKKAVECGYWQLYRYNPDLLETGKNPFVLDSREPNATEYRKFLMSEARYKTLSTISPATADKLYVKNEKDSMQRYANYKRLNDFKPEGDKE